MAKFEDDKVYIALPSDVVRRLANITLQSSDSEVALPVNHDNFGTAKADIRLVAPKMTDLPIRRDK